MNHSSKSTDTLQTLGYATLPTPRHVTLTGGTVPLDRNWNLRLANISADDISVKCLQSGLEEFLGFRLSSTSSQAPAHEILLAIQSQTVQTGFSDGRDADAYSLEISANRIALIGNSRAGLLYAVQTCLQLAQGDARTPGLLPLGRIEDWPQYELRCLHWDTKHHQDRPETLRRYLDQAAQFKINAVIYELEDKFSYPSHPVIGAPGAWTPAELQALTDYALARHIQLIPDLQAPAHMAYVLKHPEFAHLRCDGNNYQICMDNPAARRLLFDLYDDVCNATRGSKYFLVSTDEVYYAGICEQYRKPYNPENRSLTWVDYVNAAHAHLSAKGRQVIVWGEYPLLAEHVNLLPRDLLDGVGPGHPDMLTATAQHGIRKFLYSSMQGEELLFPDYFPYQDRDDKHKPGRLADGCAATVNGYAQIPRCIGTIGATWDDAGLHSETFWLGWAIMAQGGWLPVESADETVNAFMRLFHGREVAGMKQVYSDAQSGARFFEFSLERLPSNVRTSGYGNSRGKRPVPRTDWGMLTPALPHETTLAIAPVFRARYEKIIAELPSRLAENNRLQKNLAENLARACRNRHTLEVFLSLADLQHHHLEMLQTVADAENMLVVAAAAAQKNERGRALALLKKSADAVRCINEDREKTFARIRAIWEKSRFPKGQSAGGRIFVHVMDDVKDHTADRTPDLRYLIAPEERIDLPGWVAKLDAIISSFAALT
jgi:hypothetical protein